MSPPKKRAALKRAAEECVLRGAKLVVISSHRGCKDFDADEAREFESELARVQAILDEKGLEHEVRQLVRGNDPAEDLISVAEEEKADFIVIGLRRRSPVGKLILGPTPSGSFSTRAVPCWRSRASDASGNANRRVPLASSADQRRARVQRPFAQTACAVL